MRGRATPKGEFARAHVARARTRGAALAAAALALVGALALALAASAASAATGPAFGDSTWVAPDTTGYSADLTAPGPRVAPTDQEPTGEKILRTPFRVAFLPVKLVARGAEKVIGWAGPKVLPPRRIPPVRKTGTTIVPSLSWSKTAGLGAGFGLTHRFTPLAKFAISSTWWSTNDQRKSRLKMTIKNGRGTLGFGLEGRYDFKPTTPFYGLGNASRREDKSIYLQEEGSAEATLAIGRPERRLRVMGTFIESSGRSGYNASPLVEETLDPAVVDKLFSHARVAGPGLGLDLATVDNFRDPSTGVYGRAEIRQLQSLDDGGLKYRHWQLDGRAFVPVFSPRRVFAFRAVHQVVDPIHGSAPIPITLYPDLEADVRFAAYVPHRFRDRHMVLGQVEYRWQIWRKLWALGLAQRAEVAGDSESLRWADGHESYGVGLRYSLADDSAGRLEFAKGSEGLTIYLNFKGNW